MEVRLRAEDAKLIWEGIVIGDSDEFVNYQLANLIAQKVQQFKCESADLLVKIRRLDELRNGRVIYDYPINSYIDSNCYIMNGMYTIRGSGSYHTRSKVFEVVFGHSLHIAVYHLPGLEADRVLKEF